MIIPAVREDLTVKEGDVCQEASPLSLFHYIPCGAPAEEVIQGSDPRPYYMCGPCAQHNVKNRGAKIITRKGVPDADAE